MRRNLQSSLCGNALKQWPHFFQKSNRPNDANTEKFSVKLKPTPDQMNVLKSQSKHISAVLFSHLSIKAREAASKINLAEPSLEELVIGIERALLYDCETQDRTFAPIDFKGLDFSVSNTQAFLPQAAYLNSLLPDSSKKM